MPPPAVSIVSEPLKNAMVASLLVPFLLATAPQAAPRTAVPDEAAPTLLVHAQRLIVRPGEELENVSLLVQDGRILAIGKDLEAPSGARTLESQVVCAGFIDPWSTLAVEEESVGDQRADAGTRTVDALDPFEAAPSLEEALRGGVTSARVQAATQAQIGGMGALIRTHGGSAIQDIACVSATVGVTRSGRTVDLFDRVGEVERLQTSLSKAVRYDEERREYRFAIEEWEQAIAKQVEKLEKDFKKAKKDRDKAKADAEEKDKEHKEEKYKEDKKPSPPKFDAEAEVLARVVRGELPLIVEAHRYEELRALLSRTKEFPLLRLVIAGATEAAPLANELANRNVAVIVWPSPLGDVRPDEWDAHRLDLAAHLARGGVDVLIGSGGNPDARDLRMLASTAVGHGLDQQRALAAITELPARILNAKGRLGVVARGAEADLVLLDGDPIDTTARVRYVIARGRVVVEP